MNKEDKIKEIHISVDVLISSKCFWILNDIFYGLSLRAWRTDVDELLEYATASLSGKDKIPSRKHFIETCQKLYPDVDWK